MLSPKPQPASGTSYLSIDDDRTYIDSKINNIAAVISLPIFITQSRFSIGKRSEAAIFLLRGSIRTLSGFLHYRN